MATDPRPARSQSAYSNTAAKLPALPTIRVTDPQMQRFIDALRVWVDARSGARDNFEKAVTVRDLVQLGLVDGSVVARGGSWSTTPNMFVDSGNSLLAMSAEAFAKSVVDTRVFQELMRRLDDPARFDALPEQIRSRLLVDIAAEAKQRGADIRRVEEALQSQNESLAVAVDEVTAAVNNSVAGVRQSVFAYAEEGRAVAGTVTQIQARIDGVPIPTDQIDAMVYADLAALQAAVPVGVRGVYYQVDDTTSSDNILYQWSGSSYYIAGRGTVSSAAATIEEQAVAIADRAQGLEAQYTLKLQAGGKIAGFGLAATDNGTDGATSAFIVAADKFAIVGEADNISDPLNPPITRVPFGVDTTNDTIYINGKVRVNTGGTPLEDVVAMSYSLVLDLSNDQFQVATDKDGNNGTFGAQAQSNITVLRGTTDETSLWTFSLSTSNCTAQLWDGSQWVTGPVSGTATPKVRVTAMSADNCTATITATFTGFPTLTADFTGSKVKAGLDGDAATIRFLTSSVNAIKRTEAGAAVPSTVTFDAYSQAGAATPVAYAGRIYASYSTAAAPNSFTAITPNPTTDASSRTVTVPATAVYLRGTLYAAGGGALLDTETIPVISDGPTGPTGPQGPSGAQGVAGPAGVSIVWKGTFASAPGSPQNGWAYYNSTDKKSYVFQDSVWYQMTIDGATGAQGPVGPTGPAGPQGVSIVWKGTYTSAPSSPQNGWAYYNSTDKKSYVFQDSAWYQMAVDGEEGPQGPQGPDGISIVWKGESATPPSSPQTNWVYRDTDNGVVYIYNGTAWEVMAQDGGDVEVEYSINGIDNWHPSYAAGDMYLRQRVGGGAWSAAIKFVGEDGESIVWKGESATPPANPEINWVYRDTDNGLVYIYTGTAWELMVQDGGEVQVEYSITGADGTWHPSYAAGDMYLRQRVGDGAWSAAIKFVGDDGPTGPAGPRGSLKGYGAKYGIYVAAWSDAKANRVINNLLTGETSTADLATTTHLRIGDEVTLTNAASATSAFTKYWGGTGWLDTGMVIDGNLLVNGTVSGTAISGELLSGIKTKTGTLEVDTAGHIRGGQTAYASGTGFFLGYSGSPYNAYTFSVGSSTNYLRWSGTALEISGIGNFYSSYNTNNYASLGVDSNGSVIRVFKTQATILPSLYVLDSSPASSVQAAWLRSDNGPALRLDSGDIALYILSTSAGTTISKPLIEISKSSRQESQLRVQAKKTAGLSNQHAARFYAFNESDGVVSSGIAGDQSGLAFYGETGGISPFTGLHDGLLPKSFSPAVGDILVDTAIAVKRDVGNTISEVAPSTAPNMPAIGVFVSSSPVSMDNPPAAFLDDANPITEIIYDAEGNPAGEVTKLAPIPLLAQYLDTHNDVNINSLGEGQINVCGENGDIQPGDLIVTSSIPGKGMKQADDLLRSYTVARAREAATFSSPTEVQMIACIYLCG